MSDPVRKKILLVDDDLTTVLTMKRYIINAGFDVETASNGKEALEKFRQEMPDLVVIDALMPDMNGLQATRHIRELDPQKKIPIIMLSVLRADADVMDAKASGVTEFLKKPVKGEDLVKHILSYLKSPLREASSS
jgi:CheY-like chemotaxis protein